MVLLGILSGRMAGQFLRACRFPFRVGRGVAMDARFEDEGVWDFHLELAWDRRKGFWARRQGEALATINGQPFQDQLLRNGDLIGMGAVQLRFSLSETVYRNPAWRESMVWILLSAVLIAELGLVYALTALFLR
ncbi:MAG TPA: FHA domain-containing protein [Candidatus Paceibacterota bacterium]|nr:FHA domain-containing protein [Candidatus Paceibacterota bacterium]